MDRCCLASLTFIIPHPFHFTPLIPFTTNIQHSQHSSFNIQHWKQVLKKIEQFSWKHVLLSGMSPLDSPWTTLKDETVDHVSHYCPTNFVARKNSAVMALLTHETALSGHRLVQDRQWDNGSALCLRFLPEAKPLQQNNRSIASSPIIAATPGLTLQTAPKISRSFTHSRSWLDSRQVLSATAWLISPQLNLCILLR
jgi:hypothetical protein